MTTLTPQEITRAWKDEAFRNSLTDEQRAALPAAPTIVLELNEDELELVAGGVEDDCTKNSCTRTCKRSSEFTKE